MTCQIIAEISCNHLGSLERACELIKACARAGAAAVKLQVWTPGTMVLDPSIVLRTGPWTGMNLAQLYEQAQTQYVWLGPIFSLARELGIECFASVFDRRALEDLQSLRCPRYKVASFEVVDLPLIRALALTKKPLIISTGMASREEIDDAVRTAREAGCKDLTLLKCTSAYPAVPGSANLATMRSMALDWGVKAGLSDHTPGVGVAIAAAALGASMIEKHVTLSRADGGFDAGFSIEPAELAILVREAARAERSFGDPGIYGPTEHEKPQLELRRSLYFTEDLPAGTYIGEQHLTTARPARGLSPRFYWRIMGMRLIAGVHRAQPVRWECLERRSPIEA